MIRILAAAPILALVGALAAPLPAAAEEAPPTISVTGRGEVSAAPDIARVSVGVTSEGRTAEEALSANAQRMAATLKALADAGIAERDIRTTNISLSPVWSHQRLNQEPPRIEGYTASNTVTVTARDLAALGPLLDAVTKAGANTLGGIQFDLSNREALADEARAAAVADARRKAEILAKAAGGGLGGLLSIVEGAIGHPGPMPAMRMEMMADGGVPVAGGEESVSVAVSVIYAFAGE